MLFCLHLLQQLSNQTTFYNESLNIHIFNSNFWQHSVPNSYLKLSMHTCSIIYIHHCKFKCTHISSSSRIRYRVPVTVQPVSNNSPQIYFLFTKYRCLIQIFKSNLVIISNIPSFYFLVIQFFCLKETKQLKCEIIIGLFSEVFACGSTNNTFLKTICSCWIICASLLFFFS